MFAVALRIVLAVAAIAGVAAIFIAPHLTRALAPAESTGSATANPTIFDADGNPLPDTGAFQPVPGPGFGAGDANHLARYEMTPASATPALPDGTVALAWHDLWKDGTLSVPSNGDRVGTPDQSLFPAGSSPEDVMNFFLDLDDMRSLQPVTGTIRPELDGMRVRIAGYTTPVGFAEHETSFLVVPELGACIHVPPPPANQIVYVGKAAATPEMFAPVWVTGTLRAAPIATILADVGYQLVDVTTEPYR